MHALLKKTTQDFAIGLFLIMLAGILAACGPGPREQELASENNRLMSEQAALKKLLASNQAELQTIKPHITELQSLLTAIPPALDPPEKKGADSASSGQVTPAAEISPDTLIAAKQQLTSLSEQRDMAQSQIKFLQDELTRITLLAAQADSLAKAVEAEPAPVTTPEFSEPVAEQTAPDSAEPAQAEQNQAELNSANAVIAELRGALVEMETWQTESQTEQDAAYLKATELQRRLDEVEAGQTARQAELEAASAASAELRRSMEELENQQAAKQAELEAANLAAAEQQRSAGELQAQQATAQAEMARLATENTSLRAELAQTEGNTQALAQEKETLNERLARTAGELSGAQTNAAKLTSDYEVLLQEKSQLATNDETMRTALDNARRRLEGAQTEVARLSGARGIYTVQGIDSLSSIAAFFYRDGSLWPKILEANDFLVSNPDLIFPGMVLIVPQ